LSELQNGNKAEAERAPAELDAAAARSLGCMAVVGHETDRVDAPAVAEIENRDTSAGNGVGLADPGESDMTAPNRRTSTSAVRASGGRVLMGDLIGWDRVDQLASDRAKARRLAAELRRASQYGRPSVLLSRRGASGRSSA
jgi:hypothetical protein